MSLFDSVRLGSSLSVRSFSRFGSTLSVSCGNMRIHGDIEGVSAIYVAGDLPKAALSFPAGQDKGILHGSWFADALTGSDRRIKDKIIPLERSLKDVRAQKRRELLPGTSREDSKTEKESAVSWVLRELRPVSFRIKSASDAKSLPSGNRYGFIAQEVKRVVPSLVMGTEEGSPSGGTLALVYQDFLAVLTAAIQEQQKQLTREDDDVSQAQLEVQELLDSADMLERLLDGFEAASPLHNPPVQDADKRS